MTTTFRSIAALLAAGLVLAGCSSSQSSAATRPTTVTTGGRYLLTESELQAATERTLYETIQRKRPTFFRSRQIRSNTTPNPEPVHVFLDGTRVEGIETLRLFSPQNVKEVRFYEPSEANVRFGTGHHGGLIAVILLK